MPHEVGIVFHRIIDPRQKFLVMFDRLFDKPRIQTVRNHVALVRRALLTGALAKPASHSSGVNFNIPDGTRWQK